MQTAQLSPRDRATLLVFSWIVLVMVFSERSLYAVARPHVCRLSVTLVRYTEPVEIFGNVAMPFGTVAIH